MNEMTGEWILGNNIPIVNGYGMQVQTLADQVRNVHRRPIIDFSSLWFSDCTRPAQNAHCDLNNVKAWRLVPATQPQGEL